MTILLFQINKKVTTFQFIFPILNEGKVLVLKDAYCLSSANSGWGRCYTDESGALDFIKSNQEITKKYGTRIIQVRGGDEFPVTGLFFRTYDLGQSISLKVSTEDGMMNIDRDDYSALYSDLTFAGGQVFKVNKPIISRLAAILNTPATNVTPPVSRLVTDNP